jgi:HAD superfamily hydrolase (TIGR01509 family)
MTMPKINLTDYSLFLFDFDGLLVDTERLHFLTYQELCQRYHGHLPWSFEEFCHYAHHSQKYLREGLSAAVPALHASGKNWEPELYQEKKAIYQLLLEQRGVALMPGAGKLLTYLHSLAHLGKTTCVVTHSSRHDVEYIRQQHPELQALPHWITREDYQRAKPAPDGYLEAISRYLPPGGRAIGFEDSPRGIHALRQTSALPVFVSTMDYWYFSNEEKKDLHCIAYLEDLLSQENS